VGGRSGRRTRREQPVLLGLGFRPRSGELLNVGASPRVRTHRSTRATAPSRNRPAVRSRSNRMTPRTPLRTNDSETIAGPSRVGGFSRRSVRCEQPTDLACPEIVADTPARSAFDRVPVAFTFLFSRHDPVRTARSEQSHESPRVHVVQLFEAAPVRLS
jgi:hypothetical protein